MSQANHADSYPIARWSGEFADPAVEERFRVHTAQDNARHARIALVIWGTLLLLFALPEYVSLGFSREFLGSFTVRLGMSAALAASAYWIARRPRLATEGVLVSVLALVYLHIFLRMFFAYPVETLPWLVGDTMITLVGMFVVLPNRPLLSGCVGAYAVVASMGCLIHVMPELNGPLLALYALLLSLAATFGYVAAHGFAIARRQEFAALERARAEIARSTEIEAQLRQQAEIDPLTGAATRRAYEHTFRYEFERARRLGVPLALCILDLDYFKRINDTYGHAAGDKALELTGRLCRAELRAADVVGRLGGEEFVLLLPETDAYSAAAVAERLRASLAAAEVVTGEHRFGLTATIGVTELRPTDRTIQDLIQRADQALYAGKQSGRNRVCGAA